MDTSKVKDILRSMYPYREELVPCFIGAPGIGKTQGIYGFAEKIGANVVTFILSNTVPSEVSGIRMPDKESKTMEVFDDMRMSSLKDGDILFFDEILEAPPMLWSACLTLIQDRIMASGRKLPDVMIVAASNPVAAAGVIPASVRDRFQFIELDFNFEHWREWMYAEHGIVIPGDLKARLQEDSDVYNILTPRRATKLITWLAREGEDELLGMKLDIVGDMFGNTTKNMLREAASPASPKAQILRAVHGEADIDPSLFTSMVDRDLKGIFETLSNLPEWPKIKKVLGEIQYEVQDEEEPEPTVEF